MTPTRILIEAIQRAAECIDPVFLNSPQYRCEPLNEALGVELILKLETTNPIRSFKGRGADWLVSKIPAGTHVMCASAGNFGQAMAYSCRKHGIRLTVYASEVANSLKVSRMQALGAEVIQYGNDFDAAKAEAKRQAHAQRAKFVEDSLDLETVEGAGTIGLELLRGGLPIDVFLIPLGNGALFNGIATVVRHYRPSATLVAVQARGASAMIDSWRSKQVLTYPHANTIADGIAVRVPVPEALNDMAALTDDGLLVSEESIVAAMRLIHEHVGIIAEPSGAVGVAALLENPERFKHQTVATVVCGSNLSTQQMSQWLRIDGAK
jgi:threonine dehydratase